MKRRVPAEGGITSLPSLPSTSVILSKFKLLREFITATAYEDGGYRVPGYFWFMNRSTSFECILFDPDSGARLPCRGATIDEVLALVETLLGTENAPWEMDKYLSEQLSKRKKRK